MSAPIKILVLENDEIYFREIKDGVLDRFQDQVEIFPIDLNDKDTDLSNWNHLISEIQLKNFDNILAYYADVDLFIIDINLIADRDGVGLEFRDYLRAGNHAHKKIIFISNYVSLGSVDLNPATEDFVSKAVAGIYYVKSLVERISNLCNLEVRKGRAILKEGNKTSSASSKRKMRFWERVSKFGVSYSMYGLQRIAQDRFVRFLNRLILLAFYCMILVTTVSAGINIVSDFFPKQFVKGNSTTTAGDSAILTKAEHIFLYLLPIFIVFGFYNYYNTNARVYLLDGNSKNIDENESTRGMTLTKTLFIGSIISYVLIKVIEEIFKDKQAGVDEKFNIAKIISCGVLLLLLMMYFIFLDKHTKSAGEK